MRAAFLYFVAALAALAVAWVLNREMMQASPAPLLSVAKDPSATSAALDVIYGALARYHPNCPDVRQYWKTYISTRDGRAYVLLQDSSSRVYEKLKVFSDMYNRGARLCRTAKQLWGNTPEVAKMEKFFFDPSGVAHYAELDDQLVPDSDPPRKRWGNSMDSCSVTVWTKLGGIVLHSYPLCDNGGDAATTWMRATPALSNLYDSFIHEVGHVACDPASKYCGDHGPEWCKFSSDLRILAHQLGQRVFNVRYGCGDECGNCKGSPRDCDFKRIYALVKAKKYGPTAGPCTNNIPPPRGYYDKLPGGQASPTFSKAMLRGMVDKAKRECRGWTTRVVTGTGQYGRPTYSCPSNTPYDSRANAMTARSGASNLHCNASQACAKYVQNNLLVSEDECFARKYAAAKCGVPRGVCPPRAPCQQPACSQELLTKFREECAK